MIREIAGSIRSMETYSSFYGCHQATVRLCEGIASIPYDECVITVMKSWLFVLKQNRAEALLRKPWLVYMTMAISRNYLTLLAEEMLISVVVSNTSSDV